MPFKELNWQRWVFCILVFSFLILFLDTVKCLTSYLSLVLLVSSKNDSLKLLFGLFLFYIFFCNCFLELPLCFLSWTLVSRTFLVNLHVSFYVCVLVIPIICSKVCSCWFHLKSFYVTFFVFSIPFIFLKNLVFAYITFLFCSFLFIFLKNLVSAAFAFGWVNLVRMHDHFH